MAGKEDLELINGQGRTCDLPAYIGRIVNAHLEYKLTLRGIYCFCFLEPLLGLYRSVLRAEMFIFDGSDTFSITSVCGQLSVHIIFFFPGLDLFS